jgi:hypothetical protein
MAVKTHKGISVAIERLPEDNQDEILKVGTDVWNALVPTHAREGPIAISVSLLQSHVETGTSLPSSVVCSAVSSKDVQVSDRLYLCSARPPTQNTPVYCARRSCQPGKAISPHICIHSPVSPCRKDAHGLGSPAHSFEGDIRPGPFEHRI